MDAAFTAETFAPYVGKPVSLSEGPELTLVTVDRPRPLRPDAPLAPGFTLVLRGARSPVAAEGLHAMTFADGARFDLYMIPIHTPSRNHQDYQIVFN